MQFSLLASVVSVLLVSSQVLAQAQGKEDPVKQPTYYRTKQIDGLSIFYREAGPKDAPTLLLLHGLPSSSRMFEPLFARLSDRYHLVAPDYPGFGHSDWPDPKKFAYTFDHYADIMNHFAKRSGSRATRFTCRTTVGRGFSHGTGASRTGRSAHRSGRGCTQRRPRRQLGHAPRFLGRPDCSTKKHCAKICSRWPRQRRAMSETIRKWNAMTRISGPMSIDF